MFFDSQQQNPGELRNGVTEKLLEKGLVKSGDQFVLTYGDQMEQVGATNACKIVTVP